MDGKVTQFVPIVHQCARLESALLVTPRTPGQIQAPICCFYQCLVVDLIHTPCPKCKWEYEPLE
jgi:hypothetical protein